MTEEKEAPKEDEKAEEKAEEKEAPKKEAPKKATPKKATTSKATTKTKEAPKLDEIAQHVLDQGWIEGEDEFTCRICGTNRKFKDVTGHFEEHHSGLIE